MTNRQGDDSHRDTLADHADPHAAITEAVRELDEALVALGITLPSLGIDLPSYTLTPTPHPLVDLGRCNLATARRLTVALRNTTP
ncbi:hypothetical protein [Streptomyces sp. NBC_01506]|uniref:hypothetical protein n=1 Tax=Streptomyces sp. NBC_01506 TaxID=2903887 RepID=UPI003866C1F8